MTADPLDEEYQAILAFNVKVIQMRNLNSMRQRKIESDIVYRLLEDYQEWRGQIKDKQAQHLKISHIQVSLKFLKVIHLEHEIPQ